MPTHSNILAWRIPWTEESNGLQSMGWQRVGHDWSDLERMHVFWRRTKKNNKHQIGGRRNQAKPTEKTAGKGKGLLHIPKEWLKNGKMAGSWKRIFYSTVLGPSGNKKSFYFLVYFQQELVEYQQQRGWKDLTALRVLIFCLKVSLKDSRMLLLSDYWWRQRIYMFAIMRKNMKFTNI